MTATSTAPDTLTQLNAAAELARDQAAQASAKASAAMAAAQLAAERIHRETDIRFVSWASARVAEAPATEKALAGAVDDARQSFEASVAAGEPTFVATYLTWSECAARLHHHRNHVMNVRGNLHLRRPTEHAAPDTSRSTNDSRTTIPSFADALGRAVAMAAAARSGDVEDELQNALQSALRGADPATPDRQGG